ncbi:Mis12-Mtw1 protein family-domain-containing protein [Suillus clintonianus]|uniref:Mis12-Mtw1 protein family-domain-containing protein n=1 Tax=Suillus clintonianus TaxID=1904413 RepID=UPI001B8768BA|nr:Mis12-Mtw1 protein family-domain-containing protein [Suillus clintonianus]KAG2153986.1 Mis12-Mtw1 protein family-domain-containing protein [Suillus clintonianus]
MTPADPKPPGKRKAVDDANPLAQAAKRAKSQPNGASKRKYIGEEQPGGLVIVRAPISRPSTPQNNYSSSQPSTTTTRAPSRLPSSLSQHIPSSSIAGPSKPPAKRFKADSSRAPTSAKPRDVPSSTREEPELDEDIRQMESETVHLRQRSRAKDAIDPSFKFPPSTPKHSSRRYPSDALHTLPDSETPQIERNKLLREGVPLPPRTPQQTRTPQHSRRTSMSARGKRISTSFENTGVIAQPHATVSDSSFYKHIDCDLPDPQRARQLLVWSAARAMTRISEALTSSSPKSQSKSKASSSGSGKDPPPLDERRKQIMKTVQDDFIRMLAEKKIDTPVYGHGPDGLAGDERNLKPNEQNVKNKEREIKFREHIERAEAEADAWTQADHFYNSYIANSKADLERRRQALQPPSSAKAKGKQRAASQEPLDDWGWLLPREDELSDAFREKIDPDLIKRIMSDVRSDSGNILDERIAGVHFKVDSLFSFVNSAVQTTNVAESELDYRFSLLSLALSTRSRSLPPSSHSSSLSSHLPLIQGGLNQHLPEDQQDLFRALSRVDMDRPPAKVGDAAWRAVREVQRVKEGGGFVGERRLTGLPSGVGATPRKIPGTPRRKER